MLIICNLMPKDLESLHKMKRNLEIAGYEFELSVKLQGVEDFNPPFKVDYIQNGENIGNAQGLNLQLKTLKPKKGFVVIAPDLEMKENWLAKAIEAHKKIPNTGLIGWKWRPVQGEVKTINGIEIEQTGSMFGCIFVSPEAFQKSGHFLELSKYGLWDGEYHKRVMRNGFMNYYLKGYESVHNPSNQDPSVRAFKDEQLKIAEKELKKYKNIVYYVA